MADAIGDERRTFPRKRSEPTGDDENRLEDDAATGAEAAARGEKELAAFESGERS